MTETEAREACKRQGLDPDEIVFLERYDPAGTPVYQKGTGFIRGVNIARWRTVRVEEG